MERSPELPSVLQELVDEKQLKYNIVLCGSSQNIMYGLFLDSAAPLYGDVTFTARIPSKTPQKHQANNRISNKIRIFVLKNKATVMKYLSRVTDKMLQERLETFGAVLY